MTLGYTVISTLEIIGFIALVLGLIFEDRIAAWEEKMIKRLKRRIFGCKKSNVVIIDRRPHGDKVG